jgi:hypothetical protein
MKLQLNIPPVIQAIAIFLALMAVMVWLSGCKTVAPVASQDSVQRIVIRETVHDTAILIKADSSYIQYLIECEGNIAKLTELLSYTPGSKVQPPKVVIKDRILTAQCKVDSQVVYNMMKVRDTTQFLSVSKVVVDRVNYLKPWQWAQVWMGRAFMGLVVVLIAWGVWKFRRKIVGV